MVIESVQDTAVNNYIAPVDEEEYSAFIWKIKSEDDKRWRVFTILMLKI